MVPSDLRCNISNSVAKSIPDAAWVVKHHHRRVDRPSSLLHYVQYRCAALALSRELVRAFSRTSRERLLPVMRLLRVGPPGSEKPALSRPDGTIVDISTLVPD